MAEKKEKQWAVMRLNPMTNECTQIVWFDARKDAREFARKKRTARSSYCAYRVMPMTRGPGA